MAVKATSSYLNQPLRSPEEVERQRQPRTMAEKCSAERIAAQLQLAPPTKVVADCA